MIHSTATMMKPPSRSRLMVRSIRMAASLRPRRCGIVRRGGRVGIGRLGLRIEVLAVLLLRTGAKRGRGDVNLDGARYGEDLAADRIAHRDANGARQLVGAAPCRLPLP